MKSVWRKVLSISLLAVIAGGGVAWYSSFAEDQERKAELQTLAARAIQIAKLDQHSNIPDIADAVRRFVNTNSVHKIDEEFYRHWRDPAYMLSQVILRYEGGTKAPHLECSTRTQLMKIILGELGLRSRSIVVYSPDEKFLSHTLLEVFNPKTSRWETQDPTYDVYWIDRASGRRLGIHDIVASPLDAIAPCTSSDSCGWNVASREGIRAADTRPYFGLASVRDQDDRPLLVNTDKFHADRLAAFCDTVKKDCRGDVISLPDRRSASAAVISGN